MSPTAQLDSALCDRIAHLMASARRRRRNVLLEHEVYEILERLEIPVPAHLLLRRATDLTPGALNLFSTEKVVLKAACGQLTHKQQAGGVQVVHKDFDFIRYSITRMAGNLRKQGYAPEGILVAEHVSYAKDLGNEILLGFRESAAFGPVISFSKGGGDAEHFARFFSPPNLILAPIDRPWAEALLKATHIHKKYLAEGHDDYIAKIVAAGVKLSALAVAFSNFFPGTSPYVFSEFEVNPFVFDAQGRFLALDGLALFEARQAAAVVPDLKPRRALKPFFEPRGVAVAGVSTTQPDKTGNIIADNLKRLGRRDLFCVNARGGTVILDGRETPLYPTIRDIPQEVQLVVVAVPAAHTLQIMEDCVAKGVAAVILIPGGYSESRQNMAMEQRIGQLAREAGIAVIGPNCLGVVYSGNGQGSGINTFFVTQAKFRLPQAAKRNVALLSQSGALGLTEIDNLRQAIAPRVIVSYGNQLDVDPADLIHYFDADPAVDVMGCYIEGFSPGGGRKFFNAARACRKPIVVYKAGRTAAGRKATESHTASIAGEYQVAKAALKQAGLIVADTMLEHGDLIKTFALLAAFKAGGRRVAIVANAGYEKTYAADNLGSLEIAEFDDATTTELSRILPDYVTVDPLLDLTPMAGDAIFETSIDLILASPAVDALLVSIVPHSSLIHTTDDEIARNRENIAARIVRLVHRHGKPVVVSVNVASGADAVYNKLGQVLDAGGVPTFLSAKQAMNCLNAFIQYRLTQASGNYAEWLKG